MCIRDSLCTGLGTPWSLSLFVLVTEALFVLVTEVAAHVATPTNISRSTRCMASAMEPWSRKHILIGCFYGIRQKPYPFPKSNT